MAVWNIRGVPEGLARSVKSAAATRGVTLTDLVIETMEREVGCVSKKIAKVSAGEAAQSSGGTPDLSRSGKAQETGDLASDTEVGMSTRELGEAEQKIFGKVMRRKNKNLEGTDGVESGGTQGEAGGVAGRDSEAVAEGADGDKGGAVGDGEAGVDMGVLREICAGNIPVPPKNSAEQDTSKQGADICGYKEFNPADGEDYMCGLEKHSRRVKHGGWIKI